jgi:hypothetical protein
MHQVGFIYKITQESTINKTQKILIKFMYTEFQSSTSRQTDIFTCMFAVMSEDALHFYKTKWRRVGELPRRNKE